MRSTGKPILDCPSAEELAEDQRWWAIYVDSFPPEEREPQSVILDSLRASVGFAFRARLRGRTVGIASTHLLLQPAAAFLVYLAIDEQQRSSGYGGSLLEYAWSASAKRSRERGYSPLGLIWEVDIPGAAATPAEKLLRQRRVAFFQRHGGILLPHIYRQPPVNGTEAVPMQLMFRPAPGVPPPGDQTIDALIRAMYLEKYGTVNKLPRKTLEDLLL